MNYHFINHPAYYSLSEYESVISDILNRSKKIAGIKAVYHLGSIRDPGISDIDLLFIFDNETGFRGTILDKTNPKENYFFIHGAFGIHERNFKEFVLYQPHFSGELLFGNGLEMPKQHMTRDSLTLWEQIALEYLLKNFLVCLAQRNSGIIKLRQLLLEANAVKYDLEILNPDADLMKSVSQLIEWRTIWFRNKPDEREIGAWFDTYITAQENFLSTIFRSKKFNFSGQISINVSRNLSIHPAKEFSIQSRRQYWKYLYKLFPDDRMRRIALRLQKTQLRCPSALTENDSMVERRFRFLNRLVEQSGEISPAFQPPVSVIPFQTA